MNIAERIPNHPASCKGVTGPVWDPKTQCRLCWLATYDRSYRRLWGIPRTTMRPVKQVEGDPYPCRFKGSPVAIPGCGSCNGNPIGAVCNCPNSGASRCLPIGTASQEQNARSKGLIVCKECGWREPEEGLEMRIQEFRHLLEEPPNALPVGWWLWRVAEIGVREAMAEVVRGKYTAPSWSGNGIVIGAGGPRYFRCAFLVAHALRQLGCKLPIEFWYLGPREMDQPMLDVCEEFDIRPVDALSLGIKTRILGGWELKPFSILHSRFAEVLYLDADCIPIQDPTPLFDCEGYREDGAIFWPDVGHRGEALLHVTKEVWRRAGATVQIEPDLESGQLLVNKYRCLRELKLTLWMNDHSDYWYHYIYGDKDTFHLAWRVCNAEFHTAPKPDWHTPCILQKVPHGTPDLQAESILFHHAAQGKEQMIRAFPWCHFPRPEWFVDARYQLDSRVSVLTRYGKVDTMLKTEELPKCRIPQRSS